MIGTALSQHLVGLEHEVVRLVRREPAAGEIQWNPAEEMLEPDDIEGFDAVINLSGAGIGEERWSAERKKELIWSRIDSTLLLATTLPLLDKPPAIFINSSAIGYYGEQGDAIMTEADSPAIDLKTPFLTRLCHQWEVATAPVAQSGISTIILRLGVVLAPDALFLKRQLPLFKLGLGGRLGKAQRWISWVAVEDVVRAITWLLTEGNENGITGPVNLCSPQPVQNSEFTKKLGKALGRPSFLPVPKIAPSLLLGKEMIDALTESTRVMPQVLLENGYQFQQPNLEEALQTALGR